MASVLRRAHVVVLSALLMAFVIPATARAALTKTITVTVDRIDCGSACDGEGIEGPFDGEPDWFVKVFIEPVNSDDLIRLSSEVRRILDALSGKAGMRKPPAVPTLQDYLASKQAAAGEPEG